MIDLEHIGSTDSPRDGPFPDTRSQRLAPLGVQFLAIAKTSDRAVRVENHRCREHRTAQRSAANFIDSSHKTRSALPGFSLVSGVAVKRHETGPVPTPGRGSVALAQPRR